MPIYEAIINLLKKQNWRDSVQEIKICVALSITDLLSITGSSIPGITCGFPGNTSVQPWSKYRARNIARSEKKILPSSFPQHMKREIDNNDNFKNKHRQLEISIAALNSYRTAGYNIRVQNKESTAFMNKSIFSTFTENSKHPQ